MFDAYKNGGTKGYRRPGTQTERLVQIVRNVIERRAQLVADTLHRTDGGNGDKSGDQAIFNGGRTLDVLQKLEKLGHIHSPSTPACVDHGSSEGVLYLSLVSEG